MPYTTVVAGQTITASWGNTNVRDQVVTPFASAAARTSAVSSPLEGMLSYLSDVNQLQYYDGAAWAPNPGQFIVETTLTSGDITQAAAANTVLISATFTAVSGSNYLARFESSFGFTVGNAAVCGFRHAAGASVTTANTLVGNSGIEPNPIGQRSPMSVYRKITAAASGTYTIGFSSSFYSGSGNLVWSANANAEMYLCVTAC